MAKNKEVDELDEPLFKKFKRLLTEFLQDSLPPVQYIRKGNAEYLPVIPNIDGVQLSKVFSYVHSSKEKVSRFQLARCIVDDQLFSLQVEFYEHFMEKFEWAFYEAIQSLWIEQEQAAIRVDEQPDERVREQDRSQSEADSTAQACASQKLSPKQRILMAKMQVRKDFSDNRKMVKLFKALDVEGISVSKRRYGKDDPNRDSWTPKEWVELKGKANTRPYEKRREALRKDWDRAGRKTRLS